MEPEGHSGTAEPAPSRPARGLDPWWVAQQAFVQNMARLFAPPPEQVRAFRELVESFAPPRAELRRILAQVRAQRTQLHAVLTQLDSIEETVLRFAAIADAIDERSSAFNSMFAPPATPPGQPRPGSS